MGCSEKYAVVVLVLTETEGLKLETLLHFGDKLGRNPTCHTETNGPKLLFFAPVGIAELQTSKIT